MSKIKILFFSPNALPLIEGKTGGFGGAELDLWQLAIVFSKDPKFLVYFVVLGNKNELRKIDKINLTIVERYKGGQTKRGYFLRYLIRLIKNFIKIKADVYFCKGASLEMILCFISSKLFLRKKFIYRFQTIWEANFDDLTFKIFNRRAYLSKLFLFAIKNADLLIAQTNIQKTEILKNFGLNSQVLYNAHFLPPKSLHEKKEWVLWVGRLAKYKQPQIFLDLTTLFPNEKFLMIGSSDVNYPNFLKEITEKTRKIKNLTFINGLPSNEVGNYFAKAKIFLLTSEAEGFPNVFVEACKYGVPTISLNVDPDNLIKKYQLGAVAGNDFNQLVKLIRDFLSNPVLMRQTSERVYKFAKENFDIQKIILEYKKYLRDLLEDEN